MTDQDKKWINEWIDDLIELKRRISCIADYDRDLRSCEAVLPNQIHIYTGIEMVAEALGLDMTIEDAIESNKKHICIKYKGIDIYQIMEEEDAKNILHSQSKG